MSILLHTVGVQVNALDPYTPNLPPPERLQGSGRPWRGTAQPETGGTDHQRGLGHQRGLQSIGIIGIIKIDR